MKVSNAYKVLGPAIVVSQMIAGPIISHADIMGITKQTQVQNLNKLKSTSQETTIPDVFLQLNEKNVGKIDLPKIKEDLANQKEIFKQNKNILFSGLSIDDITSHEHGESIKKEVSKKITASIKANRSDLLPKIEELKKTLNKDNQVGKVENIEDVINELITNWNKFTDRPLIKAIQLAAIKQFHLPYANTDRWKEDQLGEYESHIDTIGLILEEIKSETQSFLKRKGIKELTLFRGVKSPAKMNGNGVDVPSFAALSSFTFSKETADQYATSSDPTIHPYVLVKNIPIDQILSLGVTGFGLMEHYEIVVLGGRYPQEEAFVLPGETGSIFELFLKEQAKELHEGGSLDLLREIMSNEAGTQLKKHSEVIANQLDKIIETTPDLTPEIVEKKLYSFLIAKPLRLDPNIAHEIAKGLCPSPETSPRLR
ncbi:hypothetical protein [Bacillus toyonensis]|uniref:Uncharacterized protein n=1 Tax=Bacillus toyonensis TaxID=155322 RepID=A0A2A8H7X2_9BACI|nr:hypothetical protein [Bacillus toyonensis]PEP91942.1 hypothetical protein CN585_27730 [Bacillus toyonensis]